MMDDVDFDDVVLQPTGWSDLPDLLLGEIFSYLRPRYRYYAARVCRRWHAAFWSKDAWQSFAYSDGVFCRRKFTIHAGWQHHIDYYRLRFLVARTARKWGALVLRPVTLLYNMYEFMRALTNYSEYYHNQNENPFERLEAFEFNWKLLVQTTLQETPSTYGTGGQLLQGVVGFLPHAVNLKHLSFRQLLLSNDEVLTLLGDMLNYFGQQLRYLCLRNVTKQPCPLMHVGLFLSLRKLVISPQHLDEESLIVLSDNCTHLQHLVIVHDEDTCECSPVIENAWHQFAVCNPTARVHLICSGRRVDEMIWQPGAPVYAIIYSNTGAHLSPATALTICEYYSDTLECFVQKGVQRQYRSNRFYDRSDTSVVMLVRKCLKLHFLAIRERISTATALLVAHFGSCRDFKFWTRRNAILKRSDWPFNSSEWSPEFYHWLVTNSRQYETTIAEIRKLLNDSNWNALRDKEYCSGL